MNILENVSQEDDFVDLEAYGNGTDGFGEFSEEDIAPVTKPCPEDGEFIDEYGVVYSADRKMLISAQNCAETYYIIEYGTEIICDCAFGETSDGDCKSLEYIYIPETVTVIGEDAFYKCYALTSIEIPESVSYIKDRAFAFCRSLETVKLLNLIRYVGINIFMACEKLSEILVPYSVDGSTMRKYEKMLPQYASLLKEDVWVDDNGVRYSLDKTELITAAKIIDFTFIDEDTGEPIPGETGRREVENDTLTIIDIPDSVINIDKKAFLHCRALKAINTSDNEHYKSIDGVLYSSDLTTLIKYPQAKEGTSFIIPDNVIYIDNEAFRDCKSLIHINIPDSVISIGDHAFEGCQSLIFLRIPEKLIYIGSSVLYGCRSLDHSCTPIGREIEREYEFDWEDDFGVVYSEDEKSLLRCSDESIKEYTVPMGTIAICKYAFQDCKMLESISIPESVKIIDYSAFSGCKSLKSIQLPEGIIYIGSDAFDECESLQYINLPKSLEYLGEDMDPYENTTIHGNPFGSCGLKRITNDSPHYKVDGNLLIQDTRIITAIGDTKQVDIPDYITFIGRYAFKGRESLESIYIPDNVRIIDYFAFCVCSSLRTVSLPANLEYVDAFSFAGCDSLVSINIRCPQNVDVKEVMETFKWLDKNEHDKIHYIVVS